ncbi:MAG: zinc-ribbon domain-containing protein [Chloroflexi bacterium]|nr:zinc-ribbon domain-containing protein [Chloroflexota bacterium]
MRCSNCGTENAEGIAFCMNCGTRLSSLEPSQSRTQSSPKAQGLLNRRLLLYILGVVAVLALVAVIVRLLTARQTGIAVTPKLIISQSERAGLVLQTLDLSGATKPLQLAPLPSLDLNGLSVDRGAYQDGSSARYRQRWTWSQAYVSPDGKYCLLAVREVGAWTLLRFNLNDGEPLEFLREAQNIQVFVDASSQRFIVQTSTRRGRNVQIGDLAAGNLTTLIEGADEASARPSADWQSVAYTARYGGNSAYYMTGIDGRQSRALVSSSATAAPFTSDGKHVYFSADDTLYRRNMNGGLPERLLTGRGGNLSVIGVNPQGDRILVMATGGGASDLQLLRSDGSERVSLVRNVKSVKGAAFSADGQRLLVWTNETDGDSLLLFDGHGQSQRAVFRAAQSTLMQWLASNRFLYALQERDGLMTLYTETVDGKESKRLAEGYQRVDQVASSPAGYLAFAGVKDGKTLLHSMKLGQSQPQSIDETKGRFVSVWLAPGGRVVYQVDDSNRSSIYVADNDGKNRRLLADNATIVAANLYR